MDIDQTLTALAQSLDTPSIRTLFILALVAGGLIAGAWWVLTRPKRAYRMLMRRAKAAGS